MKAFLLFLTATVAFAGEWNAVRHIPPGEKIAIVARNGQETRAAFVSATADELSFRDESGERSLPRYQIRRVLVYSHSRRVTKGLLWIGIGAGAGAAIGVAVCPYCGNEGHGSKYVAPAVAVGAGIGALGFLSSPYRTVYRRR